MGRLGFQVTAVEFVIAVLPLGLAAIGTILVSREVLKGHTFEELSHALEEISDLQEVYALNPREYLIRNWMYGSNVDRATATERVDINEAAEIQQIADEAYTTMDRQAAATLQMWRARGRRNAMRNRRRLLLTGAAALLASFLIPFLAEAAKYLGAS